MASLSVGSFSLRLSFMLGILVFFRLRGLRLCRDGRGSGLRRVWGGSFQARLWLRSQDSSAPPNETGPFRRSEMKGGIVAESDQSPQITRNRSRVSLASAKPARGASTRWSSASRLARCHGQLSVPSRCRWGARNPDNVGPLDARRFHRMQLGALVRMRRTGYDKAVV